MTRKIHRNWMKLAGMLIGMFGPVFFLGTMPLTDEPVRWSLDVLSWPPDGQTSFDHPDTRFLAALTGGFLFGWGALIWGLQAWVYDAAPEGARRAVLLSLLCWFALDSAGSITSGNASNTAFNILVLLIFAGPLWWPAETSTPQRSV